MFIFSTHLHSRGSTKDAILEGLHVEHSGLCNSFFSGGNESVIYWTRNVIIFQNGRPAQPSFCGLQRSILFTFSLPATTPPLSLNVDVKLYSLLPSSSPTARPLQRLVLLPGPFHQFLRRRDLHQLVVRDPAHRERFGPPQ